MDLCCQVRKVCVKNLWFCYTTIWSPIWLSAQSSIWARTNCSVTGARRRKITRLYFLFWLQGLQSNAFFVPAGWLYYSHRGFWMEGDWALFGWRGELSCPIISAVAVWCLVILVQCNCNLVQLAIYVFNYLWHCQCHELCVAMNAVNQIFVWLDYYYWSHHHVTPSKDVLSLTASTKSSGCWKHWRAAPKYMNI